MRFALLFALLLMLPLSYALECISNATDIIFSEQGILITLTLVFTGIVIAIAYAVGMFTGNVNFTIFAKDEAWHFAFSIALIFGFGTLLYFSCSAVDLFYKTTLENIGAGTHGCGIGDNMTSVSLCYLNIAKRDAQRTSEKYISKYIDELRESSFSVTLAIPFMHRYTSAAGAWRRVVANQYDLTLNMFVFPALLSLSMQELFLGFVSQNIIIWLVPIALLLRIFIPTRQMGNMLIALSIGLYIIVPFMYTFNLAMYEVISFDDCVYYQTMGATKGGPVIRDAWFGNCADQGNFWHVARLMPQAFFLPNLTIALLITFLAGVNRALRVIG